MIGRWNKLFKDTPREQVSSWLTWMALKYNYAFSLRTLIIDPQTQEVLEEKPYAEHRL